jgi:hypothetical protein
MSDEEQHRGQQGNRDCEREDPDERPRRIADERDR